MFIAVVGPSGVGKSSCCEAAAKARGSHYIDLDSLIGEQSGMGLQRFWSWAHDQGPAVFFRFGKELCARARAQSAGRHVLVAIGAGSIDYVLHDPTAVVDWLKEGFDQTICVYDNKVNSRARDPVKSARTDEGYYGTEYSPARERLYKSASLIHNVAGRDEAGSQTAFIQLLATQLGI